MPVSFWLSTCTGDTGCTTVSSDTTIQVQKNRSETVSDTSSGSDILQSNLSLQSLPSIPSLQKNLSPETLNSTVTYLSLSSVKPRPCHVTSLAVSGNLLYSASGNYIAVSDTKTFNQIEAFNVNGDGSVKSVAFFNGKIFTAHQDCKIRVWEIMESKRHRLVASLPTVNDRLRRLVLPKNYVQIRRHKKRLWIEHADAVSSLAVSVNGDGLLYSVSWDKTLKIWRTSDLRCVESVTAHEDAVNAVAVSVDGTVYTGSADRRIRVWGRVSGGKKHSLMATLEKHKSSVNALALNSVGSVLFSGACDRSILVWEREESAQYMSVTGALRGHKGAILCLVNASDLLFSGSADRTVRIWQRGVDGRYCCLAVLEGHERAVKSLVAVSESGAGFTVCSGSVDGEIKVWQVWVSSLKSSSSSSGRLSWNSCEN